MKKKTLALLLALLITGPILASCAGGNADEPASETAAPVPDEAAAVLPANQPEELPTEKPEEPEEPENETQPEAESETSAPEGDLHSETVTADANEIKTLEKGLVLAKVGDCGFAQFLGGGGASSDGEVVAFLSGLLKTPGLDFVTPKAACSTIAAKTPEGGYVFGRNFDWSCGETMLLEARPDGAYASFSTVNLDFIKESASLPAAALPTAAYYAPLDGMNEKGLCVSVNMISDSARIAQKSDLPDLSTTTAVRLLLDRAANVEEALSLLREYDLHGSYDMMVHFALADTEGRSVAVEYIGQEMVVMETAILTNFYIAEGEKQGVGSAESHRRYEALVQFAADHAEATIYDIRDALMTAKESAFDKTPGERTEWSVLYDQTGFTATWYRRENFEKGWTVALNP